MISNQRKVNSVRSKVLNDYGLGGEKSTYYKHTCPGHSSPEMQKTQGIDIYNFIYFCPELHGYYQLLSGQCRGLHPGQEVPLPRAGLHRRHQEGYGLG